VEAYLLRPVFLGILAALFFSSTYVLNSRMSLAGGSWMWTASLRYLFMLPLLLVVTARGGNQGAVLRAIGRKPGAWLLWSTVGFGLFYAPLAFASDYAPAWAVAGTFQLTILAGPLLYPLFSRSRQGAAASPTTSASLQRPIPAIPWRTVRLSGIMLVGVLIIEQQQAVHNSGRQALLAALPVILSAASYPIGNRKMMAVCKGELRALDRMLGMTMASLPFWIALAIVAYLRAGWPTLGQLTQSAAVAVLSGVIATVLFFSATDRAAGDAHLLARVEATQAMEIVFTLAATLLFISSRLPAWPSFVGMALVVTGMVWQALAA